VMRPGRRVVVTGAGAVGPHGAGVGALVDGAISGRAALTRIGSSGAPARGGTCCALVRDPLEHGPFPPGAWRRLDRASRMAALAAGEALASAGERGAGPARPEIGVTLGTMTAGSETLRGFLTTVFSEGSMAASPMTFPFTVQNAPASQCSILLGLGGPNLTLCRMEASGLAAIATAADLIRSGATDAMLAGGVDQDSRLIREAWDRLRVTARGGVATFRGPFDRARRGFAPGEGAYCLLLEEAERAARRGARPWAEVAGAAAGHTPGPPHRWPEDPAGPARAMRAALSRAGLGADELGYVAASANGSPRLDRLEARGLREAFGADLRRLPVSAIKGGVGESGAASACSALLAALAVRDGFVPPVAGLVEPEPGLGLNLVLGAARREPIPAVLVNALGTGGTCVSLVLSRP
jgi:3-oxoacyl-(acyl-carrier-protein) synthase